MSKIFLNFKDKKEENETEERIKKQVSNQTDGEIIKKIQKISDWTEYEYVFYKINDINNLENLFTGKYLITKDNNNYYLVDMQTKKPSSECSLEKLNYSQEVDMIIIDNSDRKIQDDFKDIINKHTILCKIFKKDLIYLEDMYKNKRIILTEDKVLTLKQNGLYTELYESNMQNT